MAGLQQNELERILSLPRCHGPTAEEALSLQREWVRPEAFEEGFRLLDGQVYGLWSWLQYGGAMAALGVGQGKTLLSLMIATDFHKRNPDSNSILLLPPALVRQLWTRDIPWARNHFCVDVPIVSLGGKSIAMRKALCAGIRGRCFLYPYSLLSTRDGQELPKLINADLVIADEAHGLTGDSARAKRWWDWVQRVREEPPVGVCLSGTLLRRSPMDYYKLAKWSMGERSPLPRIHPQAAVWADALVTRNEEDDRVPERSSRALGPVCKAFEVEFRGRPRRYHCQEAYRRRLHSTPGFIPPQADAVGSGLRIVNMELTPDPASELSFMMRQVEREWETPNGEPILYALERYELLRELSAGIWLRRYWPDRPGAREAEIAWEARGSWLKELRAWLRRCSRPPEGLDTPGLVHEALSAGVDQEHCDRLPPRVVELWEEWQEFLRRVPEGAPVQEVEPIRVDAYKVDAVRQWCTSGRKARTRNGGIIWHEHEAVGDWIEELLREEGLQVLRKGPGANWLRDDGSERYWCVASVAAHSTGRNLQHFARRGVAQLIMQLPGATACEQLLGRVHRQGAEVDVVEVHTVLSTPWDWTRAGAVLTATKDAAATLGGSRKLLVADYDPPWDRAGA